MATVENNILRIQKKHDIIMEQIKDIKNWLVDNGFKNTDKNIYERRLNLNEYLYVRLGKYVVTYGQVFATDGQIKRKLINRVKYSEGKKIIIDKITEELKKY